VCVVCHLLPVKFFTVGVVVLLKLGVEGLAVRG
jgi:hypothetical protein